MSLSQVIAQVDQNRDAFIEDLRRLLRQPSVSSQNIGVRECAHLLVEMMTDLGMEARLLETEGHPAVYGFLPADVPNAKTLLIYNHYDVQPSDPDEEWRHPPFAAVIEGDRIIARGATDSKGNLMAHLKAIDAYRRAGEPIPLNFKFIFDGEEEIGSPSLPALIDKHRELLACDAVLSFDGGFDASNRPRVQTGSSGLCRIVLRVQHATKDLHSSRARLVANPAWTLVWALASMKGPDERILVEGFYDDVLPPSPAERAIMERMKWDDEEQMADLGVTEFLLGLRGKAALERLLYQPTLNINSFKAGYLGEGSKTVLPSKAQVSLDLRLVPNQHPEKIAQLVKAHLHKHGFHEVEVEYDEGIEPSTAPLESSIVTAVVQAATEVYGAPPAIKPRGEASGRQGPWIAQRFGLGGVMTSVGPPAWLGHAPNEFMTLGHFINGIKYAATIYKRYAELPE